MISYLFSAFASACSIPLVRVCVRFFCDEFCRIFRFGCQRGQRFGLFASAAEGKFITFSSKAENDGLEAGLFVIFEVISAGTTETYLRGHGFLGEGTPELGTPFVGLEGLTLRTNALPREGLVLTKISAGVCRLGLVFGISRWACPSAPLFPHRRLVARFFTGAVAYRLVLVSLSFPGLPWQPATGPIEEMQSFACAGGRR